MIPYNLLGLDEKWLRCFMLGWKSYFKCVKHQIGKCNLEDTINRVEIMLNKAQFQKEMHESLNGIIMDLEREIVVIEKEGD